MKTEGLQSEVKIFTIWYAVRDPQLFLFLQFKPSSILFQIIAYLKFLLNSTNQHGIHSPFVYNLLTKCLYKKEKRPAFEIIENFRKELLRDHRKIKVTDFGAGSRVFKSNQRKVSDIAKNAGISRKRAILLNKLTSWFEISTALELGTSVGISSAAIAAGNKVSLTTLEGCPETAAVAGEYFRHFKLDNISLNVGSFEEKAPQPPKGEPYIPSQDTKQQTPNHKQQTTTYILQPAPVRQSYNPELTTDNRQPTTNNPEPPTHNRQPATDLVYFDGNHQKDATLKYFHQLLPLAHNDSVFIFDDIHWSKGMEEAWDEIKAHPQVRVTIDSFFWGIVFFRKEQEKEHFIIRL